MNKKSMRLAALLLVLVMMTTCFVGGTMAKYITSSTGNDSARVAYWGFENPAALDFDLFDAKYYGGDNSITVNSSISGHNLVAPGTEKTETFTFIYDAYGDNQIVAPEVDYRFTVVAEVTGLEGDAADTDALDSNKNFYWTLQTPSMSAPVNYQTVAELTAAIEKNISGADSGSKVYHTNTLPDGFAPGPNTVTIGWNWLFDYYGNDAADTEMGNADDLDDLKLTITITAEQID